MTVVSPRGSNEKAKKLFPVHFKLLKVNIAKINQVNRGEH